MAMNSEWDEVENEFAVREQWGALRTSIAAMRRLVEMIKPDPRFHDLQPSVSLGSLVFRRGAKRSVWVSWDDAGTYTVSLVAPGLEFLETTPATEASILDVLLEYLEKAPVGEP